MREQVFIAGPVSWNQLVRVDQLPEARSHTQFARSETTTLGGTSAGKALNLRSLGVPVTLRTVIGDDAEARQVISRLSLAGVALLPERSDRTERHLNLMDTVGGRVSIYLSTPEAPAQFKWSAAASTSLASATVAVIDLSDHARPFLAEANGLGVPVWTDIHDYDGVADFHKDFITASTHVFMNADGLPDPREFMTSLIERGKRLVVCTLGADGAIAIDSERRWHRVTAVPVQQIVDTNGAGDAFFAGVLQARLGNSSISDALKAGARQAALVIQSPELSPVAEVL